MDLKVSPEAKSFINKIEQRLGYQLTEADRLEILDSLFHLGKAIVQFHHLKGGSNEPENGGKA